MTTANEVKTKVRTHWDTNPMDYDKVKITPGSREYYDMLTDQFRKVSFFAQREGEPLFSHLIPYNEWSGKRVLIVGCGAGSITVELAKHGALITAVDLTPTAVKNTKKQLSLNKLKGKVLEADAEDLPFANNTFDVVWSWGVIHHTPDTKKAAQEILRVLKPGGEARVMIYHKTSLFYYAHVLLYRGVLQGRLFKMRAQEVLNKFTDHSHLGGTPLGKCYTRREGKKLFTGASQVHVSTFGVRNEVYALPSLRSWCYRYLSDSIPRFFLETLEFGWYLFMKIRK